MIPRKQTNSFYFTVEGETEKWYFSWLQDTINTTEDRTSNAKIIAKVQTPRQFLKSASFLSEIEVIHVFDYELWIILHKGDCFGALSDKKQYLDKINRLYEEHFQGLREYKEKKFQTYSVKTYPLRRERCSKTCRVYIGTKKKDMYRNEKIRIYMVPGKSVDASLRVCKKNSYIL